MLYPDLEKATWDDLTEIEPLEKKTPLELEGAPDYESWIRDGVYRLDLSRDEKFMSALDRYAEARAALPQDATKRSNFWSGWAFPTPYLVCPPLMDVGLHDALVDYVGRFVGGRPLLHLALTGWVSTERNWHQDSYLNPPEVWSRYAAAWIALDDIDDDAGPFEYVPGSHRWPVLRREKLFERLPPDVRASADWPSTTQETIARICERRIEQSGLPVVRHTPKRGEVLFWHSALMHRGTEPRRKDLLRKALILHYSAGEARPDMAIQKPHGRGWFFETGVLYDGDKRK